MLINNLRQEYHKQICQQILTLDSNGIPNIADKYSEISCALARGILNEIGCSIGKNGRSGQSSGKLFEKLTADFLEKAFMYLNHLRPGKWLFTIGKKIEDFEQYEHLAILTKVMEKNKELRATLGDYFIHPDIVIGRQPLDEEEINVNDSLVNNGTTARLTPIRNKNSSKPILHASISCKWTIRRDRSQNARTEGLNLIRNRKGKTPHIVIVTAEPYPQRIASISLGTGDIDCVYHFALTELQTAAKHLNNSAILDMLDILITGKRLRDISDLPFDLAI